MDDDIGKVTDINNETATVLMTRSSACSRCGGCRPSGKSEILIEAYNPLKAQIGDMVRLNLDATVFLKGIGILYGIPFAGMMAGFVFGYYLSGAIAGFISGGLMLVFSFFIVKKLTNIKNVDKIKAHRAFISEVL